MWFNFQKTIDDWIISGNLSVLSTDGDDGRVIESDYQSVLDTFYGTNVSMAPGSLQTGYHVSDIRLKLRNQYWNLGFSSWLSRDTGPGFGGAQALDPTSKENYHSYSFDIKYQSATSQNDWNYSIAATYFNHEINGNLKLLPEGSLVPIGSDGNISFINPVGMVLFEDGMIGQPGGITEDSSLEGVATKKFHRQHTIRFSTGYRIQTLDSKEQKNFGPGVITGFEESVDGALRDVTDSEFVFVPNTQREVYHLAIQDEWLINSEFRFTGGIRIDDFSDFGSTTNPRMALVWGRGKWIAKLIYGSAFRAPSFSELLYQNNPVSVGNPNLVPETISTREFVLSYSPAESIYTSFNIYRYYARNLIAFTPNGYGLIAENTGRQKGEGFETELKWNSGRGLSVAINGSYQNSYDVNTDARVADAPSRLFSMVANWKFRQEWSLNVFVNSVSGRVRAERDDRLPVENYKTTDIHMMRENVFFPGLTISAKFNNIFNVDAREPSLGIIPKDFPLSDRNFWVELLYRY